jgi:hypothetical protein
MMRTVLLTGLLMGVSTLTLWAQPPTGYTLAVFPPNTTAPAGSSVLPAATAPTPVVSLTWTAAQMTCAQPSVPGSSTPLPVCSGSLTETVVLNDPANAGQTCQFSLTALLQPQCAKLTPGLIYPVGVQATNSAGASDWDLSSDPFQRPVLPPAVPTGLVLTR